MQILFSMIIVFFLSACSSHDDFRSIGCKATCEKCEKIILECKGVKDKSIIEAG